MKPRSFLFGGLLSLLGLAACPGPKFPTGPAPEYEDPPAPSWWDAGPRDHDVDSGSAAPGATPDGVPAA